MGADGPRVIDAPLRSRKDRFFDNDDYFDRDRFSSSAWKDFLKNRTDLPDFDTTEDLINSIKSDFPHRKFSTRFPSESDSDSASRAGSSSTSRRPRERQTSREEERPHASADSGTQTDLDSDLPTGHKQGLHQYDLRNTVDLGQKSKDEVLNECAKNKRSMSAPPEGRAPSRPAPVQQEQPKEPTRQPVERIIPILVEGRDEPLINNDSVDSSASFSAPKNTRPDVDERFFVNEDAPFRPHFSEIYGGAPRGINRMFPNDVRSAANSKPKQSRFSHEHEQHPFEEPQQQRNFHQDRSQFNQSPHPKEPAGPQPVRVEHEQPAPETQPPPSNDPIKKIQLIQNDVLALMTQVENFSGKMKKDKEYVYLDEMLTRNLLKLDDIDTEGKENIRLARKEAIKCIQQCINVLEAKAESAKNMALENCGEVNASQNDNNKMDVEESQGDEARVNCDSNVSNDEKTA